jgi:hypothetical protein
VRRSNPEGDAEEIRPQRTFGVVITPVTSQNQENVLGKILHLGRAYAKMLEHSQQVVELSLIGS